MSEHRGNNAVWPRARVEKLKKLWAEGKSGAEIAEILGGGLSRAAVIGKANRVGCAARGAPANFATYMPTVRRDRASAVKSDKYAGNGHNARGGRPPKPGPQNVPGAVFGAVSVLNAEETAKKKAAAEAQGKKLLAAFTAPANDDAILLIDRRFGQCSWPVEEPDRPANQLCCGRPVQAGANRGIPTYCARHGSVAVNRARLGGAPDAKAYERAYGRVA